jgi:hypothetical protein
MRNRSSSLNFRSGRGRLRPLLEALEARLALAANQAPVAVDDYADVDAGVANVVNVLTNDTDPDGSLSLSGLTIVTNPSHGTVTVDTSAGHLLYTPAAGYVGSDAFAYNVTDADGAASNVANVALTVGPRLTLTSPTTGGTLPPDVTPVGGIVLDLVGKNGVRVVSQLAASSLFMGFYDSGTPVAYQGNPGTIGIQTGITQTVLNSLGGGLSDVAIRISLYDGDTGPGDFDDTAQNFLLLNSIRIGDFSDVITRETSGDGLTVLSRNADGGFRNDILDTGFFHSTDPSFLSAFYNSLTSGQVVYQLDDTDPNDNFFDFTRGVDGSLINVGQAPNISPTAAADTVSTTPATPISIDVLSNDNDPDGTLVPASVAITAAPTNGAAVVDAASGRITYTPAAGFSGTDTLSYTVNDDRGAVSGQATVSIAVGVGSPGNVPGTDTTGPFVVGLARAGYHLAPTVLTVTFSEPLDRARAENPNNYVVLSRDIRGKLHYVTIVAAQLDSTGLVVTLRPQKRLYLRGTQTLIVSASAVQGQGITDLAGNALDGNTDGIAGDDFIRPFVGLGPGLFSRPTLAASRTAAHPAVKKPVVSRTARAPKILPRLIAKPLIHPVVHRSLGKK